jgi:hypothetical protein
MNLEQLLSYFSSTREAKDLEQFFREATAVLPEKKVAPIADPASPTNTGPRG